MHAGQHPIEVGRVFNLQPRLAVVRISHFVIWPTTWVGSVAGVGDVDGEVLVVHVGDFEMKPLGVLFFVGAVGKGFFANLAGDGGGRAVGGDVGGVVANDVARVEIGRDEWGGEAGGHVLILPEKIKQGAPLKGFNFMRNIQSMTNPMQNTCSRRIHMTVVFNTNTSVVHVHVNYKIFTCISVLLYIIYSSVQMLRFPNLQVARPNTTMKSNSPLHHVPAIAKQSLPSLHLENKHRVHH